MIRPIYECFLQFICQQISDLEVLPNFPKQAALIYPDYNWLVLLGFNDTSTLVGHSVSRDSRGDERERRGRKRKKNETEETDEIKTFPLYPYPLQG